MLWGELVVPTGWLPKARLFADVATEGDGAAPVPDKAMTEDVKGESASLELSGVDAKADFNRHTSAIATNAKNAGWDLRPPPAGLGPFAM
jgi:hypothetical protein